MDAKLVFTIDVGTPPYDDPRALDALREAVLESGVELRGVPVFNAGKLEVNGVIAELTPLEVSALDSAIRGSVQQKRGAAVELDALWGAERIKGA